MKIPPPYVMSVARGKKKRLGNVGRGIFTYHNVLHKKTQIVKFMRYEFPQREYKVLYIYIYIYTSI